MFVGNTTNLSRPYLASILHRFHLKM